jgi:predicted PurR-regulated permease PerM
MQTVDEEVAQARRERWWRRSFLILATLYVGLLLAGLVFSILGGFAQIVLTVFVAWLLAFVLSPVVAGLQSRLRIGRGPAIGIVYAATLVLSGFVLFYAASSIAANAAEMADDFPLTRARIEGTLNEWENAVTVGRFQPNLVEIYREVETTAIDIGSSVVGEVPQVTAAVLGGLALVVILSLYMLADSEGIIAKFKRVVPTRFGDEVDILERTVSRAFGGFLRAQVILAGVQTALTIAVVLLVGLPYGFLIVASSALAMLIPFFGPPLALVPPILATAIFAPEWLLLVAPALLVVQTVLVNYIQPRLMQDALGMHPLLVLVGLLVGAQIAGLWGALFGIPILAVLNVFFNYVVNLRTIEESADAEVEEVLEEVRQEEPDATPEELAAIAAERVEEEAAEAELDAAERVEEASAGIESASGELRAAAGDLREAAGEQRAAADEMGETTADLRDAVEGLSDRTRDDA